MSVNLFLSLILHKKLTKLNSFSQLLIIIDVIVVFITVITFNFILLHVFVTALSRNFVETAL